MPIVQLTSQALPQARAGTTPHSAAGAAAEDALAIGFEALLALEIGSTIAEPARSGESPKAEIESASAAEAQQRGADTTLVPGLTLPAQLPAAAVARIAEESEQPESQRDTLEGLPARSARSHSQTPAAPQLREAEDRTGPQALGDPEQRAERADNVISTLRAGEKPVPATPAVQANRAELPAAAADKPAVHVPAPLHGLPNAATHRSDGPDTIARPMLEVREPLGTQAWPSAFANRVLIAATRGEQVAEIQINPPHLGPIEVTLSMTGDDSRHATVHFSSAHAAVREAIESALPRLREALTEAGIALGNATVGADTSGREAGTGREGTGAAGKAGQDDASARPALTARSANVGLIDTFA